MGLTLTGLVYSGDCSPDDTINLVNRMQGIIQLYEFIHEDSHSLLINQSGEKIRVSSLPLQAKGDISGIRYTGKKDDLEKALRVTEMEGTYSGISMTAKSSYDEIELKLNLPDTYNPDKILKMSPGFPLLSADAEQNKGLSVVLYAPEISGNTFYCNCRTRIQFAGDEFFSE